MTSTDFPESNKKFCAPADMDSNQVETIHAHVTEIKRGSCDGVPIVVTAWQPSQQEIQEIMHGAPVFLTCLGSLPPHFLTTRFEQAVNPA